MGCKESNATQYFGNTELKTKIVHSFAVYTICTLSDIVKNKGYYEIYIFSNELEVLWSVAFLSLHPNIKAIKCFLLDTMYIMRQWLISTGFFPCFAGLYSQNKHDMVEPNPLLRCVTYLYK